MQHAFPSEAVHLMGGGLTTGLCMRPACGQEWEKLLGSVLERSRYLGDHLPFLNWREQTAKPTFVWWWSSEHLVMAVSLVMEPLGGQCLWMGVLRIALISFPTSISSLESRDWNCAAGAAMETLSTSQFPSGAAWCELPYFFSSTWGQRADSRGTWLMAVCLYSWTEGAWVLFWLLIPFESLTWCVLRFMKEPWAPQGTPSYIQRVGENGAGVWGLPPRSCGSWVRKLGVRNNVPFVSDWRL